MLLDADSVTGLHHEALFYADADELLAGVLPFVERGLERGEAVLVIVAAAARRALEAELGEGERVRFAAMEEVGRNPGRIIPAWREFLGAARADGVGLRGVGETIWAGRTGAVLEECERHEALLNLAFAGAPAWSKLCPYNAAELDDRVLDAVARSHPILREGATAVPSGPYLGLTAARWVFDGELEPAPTGAAELRFGAAELGAVRRLVGELGAGAALARARVDDLVLAANEVATNSVRHGGGAGTLRVWREEGDLVCEVSDRGRFEVPLVGRVRPGSAQAGGRGLWIANQACDLVQIRCGERGSVVRLRVCG